MDVRIDPRGSLPSMRIRPFSYMPRSMSNIPKQDTIRSSMNTLQKPRQQRCYDWIFSSSSNAHVAIDRGTFKKYYPFESFVLTLSDQRRVVVKGVGTVELKIRCKAGGKNIQTITLHNVLHVPSWLCNVFSDIYFYNLRGFDFAWHNSGFDFMLREKNTVRPWGYTETFCGLDKLVLARKHDGRSPMLEDKEREVFSINFVWPQYQMDLWTSYMRSYVKRMSARIQGGHGSPGGEAVVSGKTMRSLRSEPRLRMGDMDGNTIMAGTKLGQRASGLRASISNMSLYQAALSITSKMS